MFYNFKNVNTRDRDSSTAGLKLMAESACSEQRQRPQIAVQSQSKQQSHSDRRLRSPSGEKALWPTDTEQIKKSEVIPACWGIKSLCTVIPVKRRSSHSQSEEMSWHAGSRDTDPLTLNTHRPRSTSGFKPLLQNLGPVGKQRHWAKFT